MKFPLQSLVEYKGNMYEITSAASHRAYQLSMLDQKSIDEAGEKTVSIAAREIFTHEVEFRLEEES